MSPGHLPLPEVYEITWRRTSLFVLFFIVKARNGSECQKAVMVFSDGGTATLTKFFNENNSDKKVRWR